MRNNDGKAGIIMILLGVIILVALIPWYLMLSRFLNPDSITEPPVTQTESPGEAEEPLPDDEAPLPEYEPEPIPEDEPEPDIPIEDTIVEIRTYHPGLFEELNETARSYNAVSVSLVGYDGKTGEYFTYEFGYADTGDRRRVDVDTKFRVASLAKLTTVICAMILADEGLIDLDTDISVYLGYEVKNPNYPQVPITTRMLMQHTSSVFDSGAFQLSRDRNTSESLRYLLEESSSSERGSSFRRSNQPGAVFEYSNFGYSVIGAICENVAGKTLDSFAREALFDPLDIDAGYVPGNMIDTDNIAVIYNERHAVSRSLQSQLSIAESDVLGHDLHLAQGNLTISILDYSKILTMLGNGGTLHGVRILSQDAVRAINNANVEGVAYMQGLATRHSVGGIIPDIGFYWHSGSAYGTFSQYIYSTEDNTNRGVVVVSTGAITGRDSSGMASVCIDLTALAWTGLGFTGDSEEQSEAD